MNQVVAIILEINGEVLAESEAGELRLLDAGDQLFEGEILKTGPTGYVVLQLNDEGQVIIDRDQSLELTENILADKASAQASAIQEQSIEDVLAILEAGGDLTEALEAPAAGPAGPTGAGGAMSLRLLDLSETEGAQYEEEGGVPVVSRVVESVTPLAFESTLFAGGQVLEPVAQAENNQLPPVAVDDVGFVNEEETIDVGAAAGVVESNDFDPNGDPLTVIGVRTGGETGVDVSGNVGTAITGTYGILTLNADGSYRYEAPQQLTDWLAQGQTVLDTFTYTITDGNGGTDSAELVITITGTNDEPVIGESSLYGYALEITDNAPGENVNIHTDSGTIWFSDVDLLDSHVESVSPQAQGYLGSLTTVIDNNNDTVDWTFSVNDADLDYLSQGNTLIQYYDVTISDPHGGSDTATVTITITGTNDAPIIGHVESDFEGGVKELADNHASENNFEHSDTGVINYSDVDIDLLDSHIESYNPQGTGYIGTFTPLIDNTNDTITWTFTVQDSDLDYLGEGQSITQFYDVTVTDNHGASDTETVAIVITGTNDAPVFGEGNIWGRVKELADNHPDENSHDHTAQGDIGFDDVDLIDSHVQSVQPWAQGYLGNLTATVDNNSDVVSWDFEVGDDELDHLAEGQTLIQKYDVTVDDQKGGTDTETVTITITGTNDAPVIGVADLFGSIQELADNHALENNFEHSKSGIINFSDVDLLDSHIESVDPQGTGYIGTFTPVLDNAGDTVTWTFTLDDSDIDHLSEGEEITQYYDVTVTDPHGASDMETVTITITGTNDAPIIGESGVNVSEEGLGFEDDTPHPIWPHQGLPDDDPNSTLDTTNSPLAFGTLAIEDVDADQLTVELVKPATATMVGESSITWSYDQSTGSENRAVLIGNDGEFDVFVVVLNSGSTTVDMTLDPVPDSVGYAVEIIAPVDHPIHNIEDIVSFHLDVEVSDEQAAVDLGRINIVVEDDMPRVEAVKPVPITDEEIPDIFTGEVDFGGEGGNQSSYSFAGGAVLVTGRGFTSGDDLTLVDAPLNQDSDGLGVASAGSPYHLLPNEVDYRISEDGQRASEELIIELQGGRIAYGAEITFDKMFGGELEEGVAEFYRGTELVSTQAFSSDASSGDYAANFQVVDGGFDSIVLRATDNGRLYHHSDNSDFTVGAIVFLGDSDAPIGYAEGSVAAMYGADGPGSVSLLGLTEDVFLRGGVAVTDITETANSIIAKDAAGNLVFQLQFTPSTGQWEMYQYQEFHTGDGTDGLISFDYRIVDADGDGVDGQFAVQQYVPEYEPPVSTDDVVHTPEDVTLTLALSDFGDYDDPDGDAFSAVRIEQLPDASVGQLQLLGVPVLAGAEIPVSAIVSGDLTFVILAEHTDADTTFNFRVFDGIEWSVDQYTTTVNLDAVADQPILTVQVGEPVPLYDGIIHPGETRPFNTTIGNETGDGNIYGDTPQYNYDEADRLEFTFDPVFIGKPVTITLPFHLTGTWNNGDNGTFADQWAVRINEDDSTLQVYNNYGSGTANHYVDITDTKVFYSTVRPDGKVIIELTAATTQTTETVEFTEATVEVHPFPAEVITDYEYGIDISSALVDIDGSETLEVQISGVPPFASLNQGINLGGGVWSVDVSGGSTTGLALITPVGSGAFELTVTAIATESNPGSTNPAVMVPVATTTFSTGLIEVPDEGMVVDSVVAGIAYSTTSGLEGFTNSSGGFQYLPGDVITLSIGNVVLGSFSANVMDDGKVFLQEIAGVGLHDLNDEYVENMAVLLQSIDTDGQAENGIVITPELHQTFSDDSFDLASISEQELSSVLSDNGITPISEAEAMEHVKQTIMSHTGMDAADFEAHVADGLVDYQDESLDYDAVTPASEQVSSETGQPIPEEDLISEQESGESGEAEPYLVPISTPVDVPAETPVTDDATKQVIEEELETDYTDS